MDHRHHQIIFMDQDLTCLVRQWVDLHTDIHMKWTIVAWEEEMGTVGVAVSPLEDGGVGVHTVEALPIDVIETGDTAAGLGVTHEVDHVHTAVEGIGGMMMIGGGDPLVARVVMQT